MTLSAADLGRFELLADLPVEDLERLAHAGSARRLRDGEALFVAGEPAGVLFGVTKGQIALRAASGSRSTIVMTARAGEMLGWSALRERAKWLTTGRAVGDAEIVQLPAEGVLDLLASGSPGARQLIRRFFGLAASHLGETQTQLLRSHHEGPITGG